MEAMNRKNIEDWLKKYKIKNYTIHPNLVVDVDGGVDLYGKGVKELPFQFGEVRGDFLCSKIKAKSLQGCPTIVWGDFSCDENDLNSLQYCPHTVKGGFYCTINDLHSLQHCPTTVTGNFDCSNNPLLESLHGGPTTVTGYFWCSNNNLTSLQHCPTTVTGYFKCYNNPRFEVTTSNEGSWIRVIKAHKEVYEQIKHIATDRMTATYEAMWIP